VYPLVIGIVLSPLTNETDTLDVGYDLLSKADPPSEYAIAFPSEKPT